MIDPMSMLGGISFGLGIVTFLSNTTSRLYGQISDLAEHKVLLESLRFQLIDRLNDIEGWQQIWCGREGFSDEIYRYCWGVVGYQDVESRLQVINALVRRIRRRLALSQQESQTLPHNDQYIWSNVTGEGFFDETNQNIGITVLGFRKIVLIIVKSGQLQGELGMLKTLTEGLRSHSKALFRSQQGVYAEEEPTHTELRKLESLKVLDDGFSNFASDIFEFHQRAGEQYDWSVELRSPDAYGDATLPEMPARISISFLIESFDTQSSQRFQVDYHTEHDILANVPAKQIAEAMLVHFSECSKHIASSQYQSHRFQSLNDSPQGKGNRTREMLQGNRSLAQRIAFQSKSMSIALALANWMILLWNTPWTLTPCSCRIREITLKSSKKFYVMESYLNTESKNYIEQGNCKENMAHEKLRLFGHLLAELALGTPITHSRSGAGDMLFIVDGSTTTKAGLIQKVRSEVGNVGIYEAISYCFTVRDIGEAARAEQLRELAEKVIRPITFHHKSIQDLNKKHKGWKYRREVERYMEDE